MNTPPNGASPVPVARPLATAASTAAPANRPMARPGALILDYTGVITVPLSMGTSGRVEPDGPDVDDSPITVLRRLMAHELHNPDPEGLWNRLERGETAVTELIERVEDIVPGAGVFFSGDGATSLMATLRVRDDVVDRIRAWHAEGVPLALLTNNVVEWRPHWTANLVAAGAMELFDAVVDSSDVGMRKPEERIYRHTVSALNTRLGLDLAPGDCLFIDDFEQNVVGARAIGMRALLATPDDAHWAELDSLL